MPTMTTLKAGLPSSRPFSPSASLLVNMRQELARHMPFERMAAPDIEFFLSHCAQQYFAPGEVLLQPAGPPVRDIFFIRRGAVTREQGSAVMAGGAFEFELGDMFPVAAAMAQRTVTAVYRASTDSFVLVLPVEAMRELAARSPVFADFLNRRIATYLQLSREALQAAYASQALARYPLDKPLCELVSQAVVTCAGDTSLREALGSMHQQHLGSILVVDAGGVPEGILTRHDVLGRVTLAGVGLETPIREVMVRPVYTLTERHSAQDAALLMSRHGLRHVPVTRQGVAIGMVSERDLFALQKLSLRQVSMGLRGATDLEGVKRVAHDVRRFARSLLAQGVQARQITELISQLNDLLTQRLLDMLSRLHEVDLSTMCWLALGSEGRSEQTVATDQDNALILADDIGTAQHAAALGFAQAVNNALDACGYPLCKGGVMAGNPGCCMTLSQWRERFCGWIAHGTPTDLLNANIYFDFRYIAGDASLAQSLRAEMGAAARSTPRFLKQLALNALAHKAPLSWLGGIAVDAQGLVDLKLQGTMILVDAARLYALAQGVEATSTRERLLAVGPVLGATPAEYEAWVGAFEFFQMLRLRVQIDGPARPDRPNHLEVARLNQIDRRILKESWRLSQSVQQRMQLDYER